jgi:hypothetical protein
MPSHRRPVLDTGLGYSFGFCVTCIERTEDALLASRDWPSQETVIENALKHSGLVAGDPSALGFYLEAFAGHPSEFVSYNDLRKFGDLLDRDALRSLGLRANVKISTQFLATLNDTGLADPMEAAAIIGSTISAALCCLNDLMKFGEVGINGVKFHASNMAAGPCRSASAIDRRTIPLADAPLLPLRECDRLGQCACMYQARLQI